MNHKTAKQEGQQPNLMNSRRPIRSHLLKPHHLIQSGVAAFSFKKGLFFLKQISNAGMSAGVFLANAVASLRNTHSHVRLKCCISEGMQQFSWCQIH